MGYLCVDWVFHCPTQFSGFPWRVNNPSIPAVQSAKHLFHAELRAFGVAQLPLRDGVARFVENKDFPAAHAGGNRYAPEDLFAFVQPLGHA